ncbi:hypothetical protein [Hymenobacter sediminicola]|uniref:Uncharacterized protein n=1 Tax=Hymenobacter sediminicola TaxID=2761579 RepID=A0A7G7WA82_9BACT|nr:hypothetical protein [Hymenobacter sediminicola]QNH63275.1 hypothetical protein H4317_05570 [Hymenobacter sediminicola]
MKKVVLTALFALVLGILFSLSPRTAAAQCTMCKTQVESARSEKDGYDFSGLNKGILYMAAIPYLLVGAVGYFWYRNTKAKKLARK